MNDEQTNTVPSTPPDAFAAALALIAIALDPKATEARLRSLQEHEAAAAKATAELTIERVETDQYCAGARTEIAKRFEAVQKAEVELFARDGAVKCREDAAHEVENSWRHLFESETVRSGFQSPEFAPLEKAKRWLAGLPVVSPDGDSPAGAEIKTSDTDPAARGNDPAFTETMPRGVTLARASQSPPRSARARRSMRRAAE